MLEQGVNCDICGGYASENEIVYDGPAPKDRLCRVCRKAVKDATEQRAKSTKGTD